MNTMTMAGRKAAEQTGAAPPGGVGARVARPWYREPWPWILMAGPGLVIVAGIVTVWLAVAHDDGLVADDYYKRGLQINSVLGRIEASQRSGLSAKLEIAGGVALVTVERLAVEPETLALSLRHPTRAGLDHVVQAQRIGPGRYRAALPGAVSGRWLIGLEAQDWKLRGDASVGAGPVALHP